MQNKDYTIPGAVFLILVLISVLGIKLSPLWAVLIGLVGFGVTYLLLNRGK